MTKLSPETKEILDAYLQVNPLHPTWAGLVVSHTLRVVIEQVKLEEYNYSYQVIAHINKIVDELEGKTK